MNTVGDPRRSGLGSGVWGLGWNQTTFAGLVVDGDPSRPPSLVSRSVRWRHGLIAMGLSVATCVEGLLFEYWVPSRARPSVCCGSALELAQWQSLSKRSQRCCEIQADQAAAADRLRVPMTSASEP